MKANLLQHYTKRFIAGLLAVWMSGAVFLFCCEMPEARASEGDSCPLSKTSHCDKSSNIDDFQLASIQKQAQTLDCCRLLPNILDKAQTIEKIQRIAPVAAIVKVSPPQFSFVKQEFNSFKVFSSRILNRGSTFLINCVFRI